MTPINKYLIFLRKLISQYGTTEKAYNDFLHFKAPSHFKNGKKILLKHLRILKRNGIN